MSRHHPGREELGQNFLVRSRYKSILVEQATSRGLPVIEFAGGDGALSRPLARRSRSLTVLEVDPRQVKALRRQLGRQAKVEQADLLEYRLPSHPHVIVGNLPFHLTTATLKRLLAAPHWQEAVLLVQWEAARRRAGVGGTSMLTVMWQPWFDFELICRVPASAFRPAPSVDGGIFRAIRRETSLVDRRGSYQRFVASVFKAPGSTLRQKVIRSGRLTGPQANRWLAKKRLPRTVRLRDLRAGDWADLYETARRQPRN